LGRHPAGTFVTKTPMPERVLCLEPLAFVPLRDVGEGVLQPTERRTGHADLGETRWFDGSAVTDAERRLPRGSMSIPRVGLTG
jgi:hypothetical protein